MHLAKTLQLNDEERSEEMRRLLCPACGKHTVLWLLPTTQIKDLPIKCKRCGKESVINVQSADEQ